MVNNLFKVGIVLLLSGFVYAAQPEARGPMTITVPQNGNVVGLTINQNDTNNSPNALNVNGTAKFSTLISGKCVQAGAGGLLATVAGACGSGGGGGAAALAEALGSTTAFSVQIASPTNAVVMDQSQFNGQSLGDGTTAFFSIAYSSISVTSSYTTTPSTVTIVMANCASACTVTLSTPLYSGYVTKVVQAGTGNVTLSPASVSATISGGTTALMNQQYSELDILWDGTNFWVD